MRFFITAVLVALSTSANPLGKRKAENGVDLIIEASRLIELSLQTTTPQPRQVRVKIAKPGPPRLIETLYIDEPNGPIGLVRSHLLRSGPNDLEFSVEGDASLRLVYLLDSEMANHRISAFVRFSEMAAAVGLADPVAAKRNALPLTSSELREPFAILPLHRADMIASGAGVGVALVQRSYEFKSLYEWQISHPVTYGRALRVGVALATAVKKLHTEAKVVHGCISPQSVLMDKNFNIKFTAFDRSAVILANGSVAPNPERRDYLCQSAFVSRSEWRDTPSKSGDLWSVMAVVMKAITQVPPHPSRLLRIEDMIRWQTAQRYVREAQRMDTPALGALRGRMLEIANAREPDYDAFIQAMTDSLALVTHQATTTATPFTTSV